MKSGDRNGKVAVLLRYLGRKKPASPAWYKVLANTKFCTLWSIGSVWNATTWSVSNSFDFTNLTYAVFH